MSKDVCRIDPEVRDLAVDLLNIEQRAENGEDVAKLIAEVDSLTMAINVAIEEWFRRRKLAKSVSCRFRH